MKIKYWLMISYLIIMILPVTTLYILYISIIKYDEKQDIIEFMEVSNQLSEVETKLEDISLYFYQSHDRYTKKLQEYLDAQIKITIYRANGMILYSSIEEPTTYRYRQSNLEVFYKDLNEIQKKHKTYSLKKPVIHEGEIIGFYEITISRDKWVEGVNHRSTILTVIMICFFIILFICVLYMLNRKLNKPLTILQTHMSDFANGKKINQQLKMKKDEIGELIGHFNRMKIQIEHTQLELKNQQKEKEYIVAALSHDLKTPLTVIQAYTEAMHDGSSLTKDEQEVYKEIVFEKLLYMKQMLDDLTIYTTLQSSEEKIEFVKVEGQEFFDMLLTGYDEPCAKKKLHLHVEQQVMDTYEIHVKQLIRIVDNLMSNAIRHTDTGGFIWLGAIKSTSPIPNWVFEPFKVKLEEWRQAGTVILVQNQGEPIPMARLDDIFQPFKQVESARGNGGSSGLGLSIAKMLIEKHEGKIQLWSKEGYGTLVVCWLRER